MAQDQALVDVFYVHSTSSVAPVWSAPADDAEVRAASIRGGTLIQASAFNACCAIYAPEYRQASGDAFVEPSADGDAVIAVAYSDVRAAWRSFQERTGGARPFIIASHSQGTVLAEQLLLEEIAGHDDVKRMVAAYLIGGPVTNAALAAHGLHACRSADEVGCVIGYNARAPGYERNGLEFGRGAAELDRICVNPALGYATGVRASKDQHAGAVFFDAEVPALLPRFLSSQCQHGRLIVDQLDHLPSRGALSDVLLLILGGKNYHPIEYQLFYANLRADAVRRVRAFSEMSPAH
jgi:hypothetical protein